MSGSNLEGDDGEKWITFGINLSGNVNGPFQTVSRDTVITADIQTTRIVIKVSMISLTSKIRAIGFLWK